jgi:hypothetical protein
VKTIDLTDAQATDIAARLLGEHGIHVDPVVDVFHIVHLWPQGPLPTVAEARAVAAFRVRTTRPIEWHDARPPIRPACLLCAATDVPLTHDLCDGCAATCQVVYALDQCANAGRPFAAALVIPGSAGTD